MTIVVLWWDVYANKIEKDLRPYNATRYSLYGNRRSGKSRGGVEPLLSCKYVHGNQEGYMILNLAITFFIIILIYGFIGALLVMWNNER